MGAEWRVRTDGWTAIVELIGEIDLANAPSLGDALGGELAVDDVCDVIVDLRGVTFMDSTGLAILVHTNRGVADHAGRMRLVVEPDSVVGRLLEVVCFAQLMPIHRNLDDALGAVGIPAISD